MGERGSTRETAAELKFYFDHNMPRQLANGLRQRGIDVLASINDGTNRLEDSALLERASELGRILVTQDEDLLEIAADFQANLQPFAGLIRCRISGISTSTLLDHLEMVAKTMTADEFSSNVLHVPL